MNLPITDYWINSSYISYSVYQEKLNDISSIEILINSLKMGCRVI